MQQLYGSKGFDFGRARYDFYDEDQKNHCIPDGYSTYTFLTGNYITKMPFRKTAVENNKELVSRCHSLSGTIAGELFFPARRLNGSTVNQARGCNGKINDMLHLTLESIEKYYEKEQSDYPLKEVIERYGYFFDRFASFDEYIEYNLLQDYESLPRRFPTNEDELIEYWKKSINFFNTRLRRIEEYAIRNDLFD
ncbi:hypothetical protein SDC9_133715 [bioreactor metagenome]|uniref:Uncharacterized protein n=1 Tax=bioreactor metagenome TaxID=1076179 RepID=A0A645DBR0_9ZZZZ